MSVKQALYGPRTVTALGVLLLLGLLLQLAGRAFAWPTVITIGWCMAVPFLLLIGLWLLVVVPWTWLTSRRQ